MTTPKDSPLVFFRNTKSRSPRDLPTMRKEIQFENYPRQRQYKCPCHGQSADWGQRKAKTTAPIHLGKVQKSNKTKTCLLNTDSRQQMRKTQTSLPKLRLQQNGIRKRQIVQTPTTTIKKAQIASMQNVWPATNRPFNFVTLTHDHFYILFYVILCYYFSSFTFLYYLAN